MVLVTHIPDSWTGQRQKGPLAGAAARGAARADILLTAMWMPGMDGATLARRVRSEAAFAGIRIVASPPPPWDSNFSLRPWKWYNARHGNLRRDNGQDVRSGWNLSTRER